MAACKPDIMSIDQHVDMRDAIQRIGPDFAVQVRLCALAALAQPAGQKHEGTALLKCGNTDETDHVDCHNQLLRAR